MSKPEFKFSYNPLIALGKVNDTHYKLYITIPIKSTDFYIDKIVFSNSSPTFVNCLVFNIYLKKDPKGFNLKSYLHKNFDNISAKFENPPDEKEKYVDGHSNTRKYEAIIVYVYYIDMEKGVTTKIGTSIKDSDDIDEDETSTNQGDTPDPNSPADPSTSE